MTSVAEALREAAARLAATSDTARLDAELLMAEALGVGRSDMLLRHMSATAPGAFGRLIERRARHEPVAYILGRKEFYGLDLAVSPAVLIPRADSETLIEAARGVFADRGPQRILDLGTGSGALLLAALSIWRGASGTGLDRDADAVALALQNAERTGIHPPAAGRAGGRARFLVRDWHQCGWRDALGRFDLILCNPPYVEADAALGRDVREWEPAGALFAGAEGLDEYRVLIGQFPALLAANGAAIVEIGAGQTVAVSALAGEAGFATELRRDLGGRPRALVLRLGLGK